MKQKSKISVSYLQFDLKTQQNTDPQFTDQEKNDYNLCSNNLRFATEIGIHVKFQKKK